MPRDVLPVPLSDRLTRRRRRLHHTTTDTFPARVEAEPRCAIAIVDFHQATGLVQHVGMRGHATIQPFDPRRAWRLLARYLGPHEQAWDARFRTTVAKPTSERAVLLRFVPETVVARDVSYAP